MNIQILLGALLTIKCITGLDPTLDGDPRRTFPLRRAIDGTRGRKYYEPEVEDAFDIYGSTGQYNPYDDDQTGFDDIRSNVPGEPGVDYPSLTRIPQTNFQCQGDYRGYYADEEAGCQLFHVCDSTFLVSSFLCPIGSIFSQKLLTCDWWNKVDCSSTRNYYTVNSQTFPTEVDDDEILRKAYEMTTLQTSPNRVSISSQDRNAIPGTISYANDLQTGPTRYDDYDKIEYKYSSRYNAEEINRGLFSSRGSQRNPRIKIHTIGQDEKNDADDYVRDFRPSYAPTVPTVTTTTRRFYSPTVPATTANPGRQRYDLEFEGSDHLYSARGKSGYTTTSPVTKPTVDTTTVVVEVPPTLSHSSAPDSSSPSAQEIITEKSRMVSEFTMIEFQSLHNGENHTYQIDIDADENSERNNLNFSSPATDISPPFFYYNNAATADDLNYEEHNATASSNHLIINVPATDIIPPLFSDISNETRDSLEIELRPPEVGRILSRPMVIDLGTIKSPEIELRPPGFGKTETLPSAVERGDVKVPEIELSPPGFEPKPIQDEKINVNSQKIISSNVEGSTVKTPELSLSPPGFEKIESNRTETDRIQFNIKPIENNIKTPEIMLSPPGFGRIESEPVEKTNVDLQANNPNVKRLEVEIKPPEIVSKLPELELLPPLYNEVKNFTINVPELSTEDTKNFIRPPASVFLPPYLYYSQANAIEQLPQEASFHNETMEGALDSAGGESSPYQVTLTVKGDEDFNPSGELIKSLIAQQDDSGDIHDVEILMSNRGQASSHLSQLTESEVNPEGRESRSQPANYALLQGINSLGIVGRRHPQYIPRPFSVKHSGATSSDSRLNSNSQLNSNSRINSEQKLKSEVNSELELSEEFSSEQSDEDPKSQVTFNPPVTTDGPLRFDLPQFSRTSTFRNEKELKEFKKINDNKEDKTEKPEVTTTQAEVIPSIGFSLNTEKEREEFKEAVLRGLITDFSISNAKSSTKSSVAPKVTANVNNKEKQSEDES